MCNVYYDSDGFRVSKQKSSYHLFHLVHRLFPVFYLAIAFMYLLHCLNHIGGKLLLRIYNFNYYPRRLCGFHFAAEIKRNKSKHQATVKSIVNHPGQIPKSYWRWNIPSTIVRGSLHSNVRTQ